MNPSMKTRLLVVQLLALGLAVAGDVAGSRFVTATGVTAFFLVFVALLVTLAGQRLPDVVDWLRTRSLRSRRTDR
jgi:hypothetical protein